MKTFNVVIFYASGIRRTVESIADTADNAAKMALYRATVPVLYAMPVL